MQNHRKLVKKYFALNRVLIASTFFNNDFLTCSSKCLNDISVVSEFQNGILCNCTLIHRKENLHKKKYLEINRKAIGQQAKYEYAKDKISII